MQRYGRQALALTMIGLPALAQAPDWYRAPAFSLSAEELRKVVQASPAKDGYPVTQLLQEELISVDEGGRRTTRSRQVFRVEQLSGLEFWSMVRAQWAGWFQERPVIRARVLTPEGQEITLDPATIGDFSVRPSQDSDVLTDRKEVRAPLPKLTKGAVVEVETLTRETRPFSQSGVRGTAFFWSPAPVEHSRFALEAPAGMAMTWKLAGLPGRQVRRQAQGGRALYELEFGPTAPAKAREAHQASDQEPFSVVRYSAVPSWQAVAGEYDAIVEGQLKGTDVSALAKTAVGGAKDRAAVVERLLAHVQKSVRYTGLEFGEASIVPQPPAEVLRRGYGDCKDKATLLVALLRSQGIEAHVALLYAGLDEDTDPELPGLGWFDHAIVYLPGKTPLWIDATARHARVGQLPLGDQGRYALVAAKGTKALIKTPVAPASENLTRHIMDVQMGEDGAGKVTETLEGAGSVELALRSGYSGAPPDRVKTFLTSYALPLFKAKSIDQIELSDPDDLSKPFRRTFLAQQCAISFTGSRDAMVSMNPWPLISGFDAWIRPGGSSGNTNGEPGVDPAGRRTDALFPSVYANEARWIVHPPVGYSHGPLPEAQTQTFGAAKLTIEYVERAGDDVEVRMRFESPERRWSAKQIRETKEALEAYSSTKIPRVFFQQKGEAHLAAGRVMEALKSFRQGVEAQPKQVVAWTRLARAQMAAGLGVAARASARKAIEVGPQSVAAYECLGMMLQYDLAGRRFKPGWDRTGSIAAFRKAIELDPRSRSARWDMAIVLERGEDGTRYASADVEEALSLYKALESEEKHEDLEDLLVSGYAALGRFDEARKLAQSHPGVTKWQAWEVAMIACTKGVPAALNQAAQEIPNAATRGQVLVSAGNQIVRYRKYAEASALIQEGASSSEQVSQTRARGEFLAKVRPASAAQLSAKDPRMAPLRLYAALFEVRPDLKKIQACFSAAQPKLAGAADLLALRRKVQYTLQMQGTQSEVVADSALTAAELSLEGNDERGYRVDVQLSGTRATVFVAAEEGGYRVVAVDSDALNLGRQASWAAAHGNLKEAGAWLDRSRDLLSPAPASDAFGGHPMLALRSVGQIQTAQELQIAAAALVVMAQTDDAQEQVLKEAYEHAAPRSRQKAAIGLALCHSLLKRGAGAEAEALTRQLCAEHPESGTLEWMRARYFALSGRWQDLLDWAERGLKAGPDEPVRLRWKAQALLHLGRYQESEALSSSQIGLGKATVFQFNEIAWGHVMEGRVGPQSLDYARRANQDTKDQSLDTLHTLTAVLAEMGRVVESRESLLKLVDLSFADDLRSEDWFLMGRIAEQYGEPEAAKAYYAKVGPLRDANAFNDKRVVQRMARARLRALGVAVAEPVEEKSRAIPPKAVETTSRAYYEAHLKDYRVPGSFDCRYLLVRVNPQPRPGEKAVTEAEALKRVAKIQELLASGQTVANLAETYSDDPGSKHRGGLFQNVTFGTFAPEFDAAVRRQEVGKVGEPVRTSYGYCIILVERVRPDRVKSYDEVAEEIRKRLLAAGS